MSGLTGHINHLFEDPNLTLSEIIKIYRGIASRSSDFKIYEKVDGYNIYLSYSAKEKKAKLLRNNSQLKTGGISIQDLREEFTTKKSQSGKPIVPHNVVSAYVSLTEFFEKVVTSIFSSDEEIKAVFGEDSSGNPEYFFNAEIIDPSAPNIIKYDRKMLIFHKLGNVKISSSDGSIVETDDEDITQHFEELTKIFGKGGKDIEITGDRPSQIDGVNKDLLESELRTLHDEFKNFGLDMEDSIGKLFIKSIEKNLNGKNLNFDNNQKEFIVKSVLAVGFGSKFLKKPKINEFFKQAITPQTAELKKFSNEEPAKELFKTLKKPIEKIFFNCSSILLDKYESIYLSNNKQTADDIIKLVNNAVNNIKVNGSNDQKNNLQLNMNKLRSSSIKFEDLINNPVEGIVFKFKNRTYKITSSFGPVNQIVNMSKMKIDNLKENKETKIKGIKVLFAGAFKPPHKGHLEVIKNFIQLPFYNKKDFKVEKIIVIMGNKPRYSKDNQEFNLKQSFELFKLFIKSAGLESIVELRITERDNPVKDVYDYIANSNNDSNKAQSGDTILLGTSKKDKEYYTGIMKFVQGKPWTVLFGEEYEVPIVFRGEKVTEQDLLSEFTAGEFREAISKHNYDVINSFLPDEVLASREYKFEAYKILGLASGSLELKEEKIINIINQKLITPIKKPIKLDLGVLINRVNSIYTDKRK